MSPRSLVKNIPSPNQEWKAPVKAWIRELHERKQRKAAKKKSQKRDVSAQDKPEPPETASVPTPTELPVDPSATSDGEEPLDKGIEGFADAPDVDDDLDDSLEGFRWDQWHSDRRPTKGAIEEQNERLFRRRREFRTAAEFVAHDLAQLPQVQKIVLFGSVVLPLRKEIPRFREYRRAGIAVWHECSDVDLAVWVTSLDDLKSLQTTRGRALNRLFDETDIGVAHHQVEIFLMEPETDRYLGRLCIFGTCPKEGKHDCLTPGCGDPLFLAQQEGFRFKTDALRPEASVVLFDRAAGQFVPDDDDDRIPF